MIEEINIDISSNINKEIINNLFKAGNWHFGSDKILSTNVHKNDCGLTLDTGIHNNDILNTYANVIFYMVEKNTFMKFKKIERIRWNWYHSNSVMEFHEDHVQDNKFSIIYNLHDNDGGTEFKINDEIKFYQSEESKALFFPSKIEHRGIATKKNVNRFCLNMVIEI